MKKRIRMLLVVEHELTRHGLRRMLELTEDMEVVGDCANAEEAFPQIRSLSPDVVLMDAQMSGMNGIEATRYLKGNGMHRGTDIIILAECADYCVEALEAGAAYYILKSVKFEEIVEAIRQVYRDKHLLSERQGSAKETVELVIPPPADAAQTMRFVNQVEQTLNASILHTIGSRDRGIVTTIRLKPATSSNLLDMLRDMPDVGKVDRKLLAKAHFPSLLKKLMPLPSSRTSCKERILVTLKTA